MDSFIQHFHSGLAYLVLLGLLLIIVLGLKGRSSNSAISKFEKVSLKVVAGLIHLQALVGILFWIMSPKIKAYLSAPGDAMKISEQRRIFIEHPLLMLIAVVVFTIGNKKIRKAGSSEKTHKNMVLFGVITLALISLMVPWELLF